MAFSKSSLFTRLRNGAGKGSKVNYNFSGKTNGPGFTSRFMNTKVGKGLFEAGAMDLGFEMENGAVKSFLGFKNVKDAGAHFTQAAAKGGAMGVGKALFEVGQKFATPAFTLFAAYEGYQEGGIGGAAKNVAMNSLMWGGIGQTAFGGIKGLLVNPVADVAIAAAAIGYGGYKFGEASRNLGKRVRNTELGAEVVDRFGQAATIRQRSLQALNSSHINGRVALGNEAQLMHMPMPRLR